MKMKKILMTGACLAALAGPAFADCPYISQFNSVKAQYPRAVGEAKASKKCSPEMFSALERVLSISRQLDAILNRARGNRGCKVEDNGGAKTADVVNALQKERAECAAITQKKQEEERAATLKKQEEERARAKEATPRTAPPGSQQRASCSDITGVGTGHPNYEQCRDATKLLEKARQFRKDYPALKDTEKGKNTGWRDLYRQAAAAFRLGGDDPDRAEEVYKEMNAPDVQPFIDAENKATAKAKRDYALKEAEDELRQANIIYNAIKDERKPECYDADIAADRFQNASKAFAMAGRIEDAETASKKSILIRKWIFENIEKGACTRIHRLPQESPPVFDSKHDPKDPEKLRREFKKQLDYLAKLNKIHRQEACEYLNENAKLKSKIREEVDTSPCD